jgi:hypothetical protein
LGHYVPEAVLVEAGTKVDGHIINGIVTIYCLEINVVFKLASKLFKIDNLISIFQFLRKINLHQCFDLTYDSSIIKDLYDEARAIPAGGLDDFLKLPVNANYKSTVYSPEEQKNDNIEIKSNE